jgi:hypothetical protein
MPRPKPKTAAEAYANASTGRVVFCLVMLVIVFAVLLH